MAAETNLNGRTIEQSRLVRKMAEDERSAVGRCTKYFLFFVNFLLLIGGLGVTVLGTYILVVKEKVVRDGIDFFLDPACDMCLAGCIIVTLAFFGCLGSLREITCCLKIYYYSLSIFLLAELALAILLFVSYYVPEVKKIIFPSDTFKRAIVAYRDDPDMQLLIDSFQKDMECCGMSDSEFGFRDWNQNMYFNCSVTNLSPEKCSVPYSCCKINEGEKINYQCGSGIYTTLAPDGSYDLITANTAMINTDGCAKALGDWIIAHALIIGGVTLGILVPQIFLVILSRNLIDMINLQKSKW